MTLWAGRNTMKYRAIKSALIIFMSHVAVVALLSGIAVSGLSDGLIAFYPFNSNARDESGSGLDGIVYGASLSSDRFGFPNSAYYFEGSVSNIIELPQASICDLLDGLTSFSVSAWVRNNGPGDIHRNILRLCDTGGDSRGLMFRIGASSASDAFANKFEVLLGTTDYQTQHLASVDDIPTDLWTHVAMVYDGSLIWLYVNGVAPKAVLKNGYLQQNPVAQTGQVTMGNSPAFISAYSTETFHGVIDDIRIYTRGLSAGEVQRLFFRHLEEINIQGIVTIEGSLIIHPE
jgi:hypothetical protein